MSLEPKSDMAMHGATRVDIRRREFLRLTTASVFAAGWVQHSSAQDPDGRSAFDVRSFGATADGKTLDTPAVNRAIAAAAAIGGGTVRFPAVFMPAIPFASRTLSRSILNRVQ